MADSFQDVIRPPDIVSGVHDVTALPQGDLRLLHTAIAERLLALLRAATRSNAPLLAPSFVPLSWRGTQSQLIHGRGAGSVKPTFTLLGARPRAATL